MGQLPEPEAERYQTQAGDEAATQSLAIALAMALRHQPDVATQPRLVQMRGELGAGKSTFTRAFLRELGVAGRIKSPTYALFENYPVELNVNSTINFYHFDLYRFREAEEWEQAGFSDAFVPGSVAMIEWPERAARYLPVPDLDLVLMHTQPETSREILLQAQTDFGRRWLATLPASLQIRQAL
jgi:tRNA threonylcarbamoyladenosine biosynthesis protein TsaE